MSVPPRLFDCPAADYHADNVGARVPTLSHSVAVELIARSPRHAWALHPKLNPAFKRAEPGKFDMGRAAHALMLRDPDAAVEVIDAEDYRTKAAKEARDGALAAGKLPLLAEQYERAIAMVNAAREQLAEFPDGEGREAFTDGEPERTLVWSDGGVVCRARFDWLFADRRPVLYDYKTTDDARPEAWARIATGNGADLQAAFYSRGFQAMTGTATRFRFVVQETWAPFALSIIELEPAAYAAAAERVEWAIQYWGACLATGQWPGYPRRIVHVEAPAFAAQRFEDRKVRADFGA